MFSYSLKHQPEDDETDGGHTLTEYMVDPDGLPRVDCIVNTMGLAMSDLDHQQGGAGATVATGWSQELLDSLDVPIIQGIVSTGSRTEWEESSLGLGPIDTAMNVAFPEFDGRIIAVPVSFKEDTGAAPDTLAAGRMQRYVAQPDRMDYLAPPRLPSRRAAAQGQRRQARRHHPQQLPHQGRAHRQRRWSGHSRFGHQPAPRIERRRVPGRGHPR